MEESEVTLLEDIASNTIVLPCEEWQREKALFKIRTIRNTKRNVEQVLKKSPHIMKILLRTPL